MLVLVTDQGVSKSEMLLTPGEARRKAKNVQEGSGNRAIF